MTGVSVCLKLTITSASHLPVQYIGGASRAPASSTAARNARIWKWERPISKHLTPGARFANDMRSRSVVHFRPDFSEVCIRFHPKRVGLLPGAYRCGFLGE